jgi:PAS domain S-box-containing protein
MTNTDSRPEEAAELRKRAEEIVREKRVRSSENIESMSPAEIRRMLEDLRVHQIELEMQNEELRRAHAELEAARERYFSFYDLAPVGYATVSEKGMILEANLTTAKLLGVVRSTLVQQPISRFIFKEDQDIYYLYRKRLYETGETQGCEVRMVRDDKVLFCVRMETIIVRNADGEPVSRVVLSDITERKRAEERLNDERNLLGAIINAIPDEIAVKELERRFVLVNPPCVRVLGKDSVDEVLGRRDEDLIPKEFAELSRLEEERIFSTGKSILNREGKVRRDPITGEIQRAILISKSPIRDKNGTITGLVAINRDITERKRAEDKIREKDLQFRKLSSHVPDLIYQFTRRPDGSYFVPIASVGIKNIFGCSPEDVLEDFSPIGRVIFPEDAARVIDDIEYSAKHLTLFTCEFRVQIPGKAIQWILSRSTPEQLPDGSVTWYGFNADITERKQVEGQLRRNLEEKEVLLREVHHRVKNNLTVISSLLNLQSFAIQTPEQALAAFRNSRDRIMSMALVHEELYKCRNYARVDMSEYLESLTRHLLGAYGSGEDIHLCAEAGGIVLGVDAAIPCGLILSELITNALKYAFPGGGVGDIHALLRTVDDGFLELSVSDNGIGLSQGYESRGTLGLSLVQMLTEQLDGTLDISTGNGTRCVIRFPKRRDRE